MEQQRQRLLPSESKLVKVAVKMAKKVLRVGGEPARIYLGFSEPDDEPGSPFSSIQRVPYLTVEYKYYHTHDWFDDDEEEKVETNPFVYHEYVLGMYGIPIAYDFSIFVMGECPPSRSIVYPTVLHKWLRAFRGGWRFHTDGRSGYFEIDDLQLSANGSYRRYPGLGKNYIAKVEKSALCRGEDPAHRDFITDAIEMLQAGEAHVSLMPSGLPSYSDVASMARELESEFLELHRED